MAVKKYIELELVAPPGTRCMMEPRTNGRLEPGGHMGATMVLSMHGEAHVARADFKAFVAEVEAEWDICEEQHKKDYERHQREEREGGRVDH